MTRIRFRGAVRRLPALVAAVGIAVVLTVVAAPAAPAVAAPPTLDEIYQRLGIDTVSADYVIVLDTSLSMKADGLYTSVVASVKEFVAALAPQDNVTLISVASQATVLWEGKAGSNADAVVAHLPPAPDGQFTDLGAGIDAAVGALSKLTNPIASVVLLTDGQHDPAPGSAYPYAQGYSWNQLIDRASKLKQQVQPYAIQLRGKNGAGLLQKVFPKGQLLNTAAIDQLTGQLNQPKEAVRASKARAQLAADAAPKVDVSWPATVRELHDGRTELTVTMRNPSKYLPLDVSELTVDVAPGSAPPGTASPVTATAAGGTHHLEPGAAVPVVVSVTWDAGPSSWQPVRTATVATRLELRGKVTSEWAGVAGEQLGVQLSPALAGASTDVAGSADRGSLSWWLLAAIILVVLLIAAARARWLRLHPIPGGTLVATPVGATGGSSMPLQRRRNPITGTLGIPGNGEAAGRRHRTGAERVLAVTYSPDGTVTNRRTDELTPGGTVELDNVTFEGRP